MNSKVARVTRLGPLEPRQGLLLVGTQDPFALGGGGGGDFNLPPAASERK
jgi:hypothetical protein